MASVEDRPRIRPDIVIRYIPAREEPYVIAKDPLPQKYYKFEPWEHDLLLLLDGTRDYEEIAEAYSAKNPAMPIGTQDVVDYVEGLKQLSLIEKSERERHLAMMEHLKSFRRKRFYDAEKSSLFQIQIPLFDPDHILGRIVPWIRWMWAPWFVIPWVVVFIGVLGFLVHHWDLYWSSFWNLLDITQKGPTDWALLIAMMFTTGMWHELGHGFTCKRFGGEVRKIGIMIFYLEPAFYCGVDDSYMFPNRGHRMWVAFGGSYFELMLCAVAMLGWLFTPAEWFIHELSLMVVLLSGLSLVAFNLNPLIRLDGYYVIMDWLDVPDLREDSFRYIGSLIKRYVLHLDVQERPISKRRRRIYMIYGILSILYTTAIMVLLYNFILGYLLGWFGPAGYLVILGLIGFLFRRKLGEGVRFLKHLWLDKRDLLRSPRGALAIGAAVFGLVLLATVPRSATRIDSAFTVEPGRQVAVRAPTGGVVGRIDVSEGSRVRQGESLAMLRSPELKARRAKAEADRLLAARLAAEAKDSGDAAQVRQRLREAREAQARVSHIDLKLARLRLTVPIDGVVATRNVEEMQGRMLEEGDELLTVADLSTVILAVSASELEIAEVAPGTQVRIRAHAYPGRTLRAEVLSISPVARPPAGSEGHQDLVKRARSVRVLVEIGNEKGLLRPGMSGTVQFLTKRRSHAGKIWWQFSRWAGSVFW